MTRTRMTCSAWIEANGLRPKWAKEGRTYSSWWDECAGQPDQRETLIRLGVRWFESKTSPGMKSLVNSREPWTQEIAAAVARDIIGEDPAVGRWRGEDGYILEWNGIGWHRGGIASVELRGIETLPHRTAACGIRGCTETQCKDALQRLRTLARVPGRPVTRVYA